MLDTTIGCLILAAGKGIRMYASQPKVLMEILGESILWYVFKALTPLFEDRLWTVIGHKYADIEAAFVSEKRRWVYQAEQLGTGHALQLAWPDIEAAAIERLIVVNGDIPLLPQERVLCFVEECVAKNVDLGFITLTLDNIGDFGRVVRQDNRVVAIVEAKDYHSSCWGIESNEINTGIYYFKCASIATLLPQLTNDNISGEIYITDVVNLAARKDLVVVGINYGYDPCLLGINTPLELVTIEELKREAIVHDWLQYGVIIHAPTVTRISPRVRLERGCELTGPCELLGSTIISAGARIASHTILLDSYVAEGAEVKSFSHLEGVHLKAGTKVGPFARLRPGAILEEQATVGNFVEIKKTVLGSGTKVGHLSYIGDAHIGAMVNIGAGTIICNYNGKHKYETYIDEGVFIGSNTALIAPVRVGHGSLVGAGSVITKDVPAGALAIGRARQKNLQRKT